MSTIAIICQVVREFTPEKEFFFAFTRTILYFCLLHFGGGVSIHIVVPPETESNFSYYIK